MYRSLHGKCREYFSAHTPLGSGQTHYTKRVWNYECAYMTSGDKLCLPKKKKWSIYCRNNCTGDTCKWIPIRQPKWCFQPLPQLLTLLSYCQIMATRISMMIDIKEPWQCGWKTLCDRYVVHEFQSDLWIAFCAYENLFRNQSYYNDNRINCRSDSSMTRIRKVFETMASI